eukprot:g7775.t1
MVDGVARYQGCSPVDHGQALDHGGRRPLPSLHPAGETQRAPRQQSTSLAHLARVSTGKAFATAATPVAANNHLRRHSNGSAVVPGPCSHRLGEGAATPWYTDNGGEGGVVVGSEHSPAYRDHRRGSRCQPQWSSNPLPESLFVDHAPWAEGLTGQDPGNVEMSGEGGHPRASPPSWRLQPSEEHSGHQYSAMSSSPTSTSEQTRGEGYGRVASSPSIQHDGGDVRRLDAAVLSSHGARTRCRPSHIAADAALGTTVTSSSSSWDIESGGRSGMVQARQSKVGGSLASLGLGERQWSSDAGDRGSGTWENMDIERLGEAFRDDQLQRGSPAQEQQQHRYSSLPQLTSMMAPGGSGVEQPGLGHGGNDPDASRSAGLRPPFSGMAASIRSSYPSPWPTSELHEAAGGQAAGGRGRYACDPPLGVSGRQAGAGGGGAEEGRRGRSRLSDSTLLGPLTCIEKDCEERSRFAYKGEKVPSYCATHRLVGMVDTRHPRCKAEECTKQPSFGLERDRRASYCSKHKKAGMVNVTSRRCQEVGCGRNPNFGFPGDRRATYCKGHREVGMVDIVSRRCRDPSCSRRPLYNMSGLRPVFCREHKLPEMIDVISARCQELGCVRHPSFGYVSDMKARRCARHRLVNMEGVKGPSAAMHLRPPAGTAPVTSAAAPWVESAEKGVERGEAEEGKEYASSPADAAGLLPSSAQDRMSSFFSNATGTVDGVGRYQGCSPFDHGEALNHGGGQPLPSQHSVGEAQRTPRQQSTSLAHLPRVSTGNAYATAATPVAANNHLRRHSNGSAVVPGPCSPRLGEGAATPWYTDNGGDGGVVVGSALSPAYRDHRRGSRCQPQWSSNPLPESLFVDHASWAEGLTGQDPGNVEMGGEGGHPRASPPSWRLQPSEEHSGHQYSAMSSSPTSTSEQTRGEGYGRAASSPSIQHDGGDVRRLDPAVLSSHGARTRCRPSHIAEDAALATTVTSSSSSWEIESGGRSGVVQARQSKAGGSLASLGLGERQWSSDTGDRSSGTWENMDIERLGEAFRDDQLQRGSPAQEQQQHRYSSLPQLTSMLTTGGSGVEQPGLGHGGNDPDASRSAGLRPPFSGMAASFRSSYPSPWPTSELREAAGGQAAGGRGRYVCDPPLGAWGRQAGGSGGGAEEGGRGRSRLVGMVDTRHPRCKAEECTKQPSFGLERDRRASYCSKHKKAGMVNVTSRRCREIDCGRNPNFGFRGDRRATYCKGHREVGMVDIVSRRCVAPSCSRRPLYNMIGLRPVFCREHKCPGMIDVISPRCQELGCVRHPSFGYISDMKARRCARHRLVNMEGVKGRRRVTRGEGTGVAAATTVD